jgi:hypothetical protein
MYRRAYSVLHPGQSALTSAPSCQRLRGGDHPRQESAAMSAFREKAITGK